MYKNVKFFLMILFSFFIPLGGMHKINLFYKIEPSVHYSFKANNTNPFQKKCFTTSKSRENERDLITYYLENKWYFKDTSLQAVKQGAEILNKYGPCVYTQCVDPIRKENMRQLFAHNSAMAHSDLKKLKFKKMLDISIVALNTLAVSYSMVSEYENFFMASFFAANCFSGFYSLKRINENNYNAQIYQNIIDAYKAIESHDNFKDQISNSSNKSDFHAHITNYDEMLQKGFKDNKN